MAKILITQQPSLSLKTAYASLSEHYGVDVHFQSFSEPVFLSLPEFRTYKPSIQKKTAFLFSNATAIHGFFKRAERCSIKFPDTTKYFLAREGLQKHLQKYIEIKKRKLFCGQRGLEDFFPILPRYKNEHFFFPCSNVGNDAVRDFFTRGGYNYTELALYKTVVPNLSHMNMEGYDIIVFFSPVTIRSFHQCFPKYDFSHTKVAAFGQMSAKEVNRLGWPLHISVPAPGVNSMLAGLENYFDSLEEATRRAAVS